MTPIKEALAYHWRFEWHCTWDQFLVGASWGRIYSIRRSFCLNLGPLFFAWYAEYDDA